MALNKEITSLNGVVTNYHKIDNVRLDKCFERIPVPEDHPDYDPENVVTEIKYYYSISFRLSSYVSEEIRQKSEMYAAEVMDMRLRSTIEEAETTPIFELTYNKIKELTRFKDAIDC